MRDIFAMEKCNFLKVWDSEDTWMLLDLPHMNCWSGKNDEIWWCGSERPVLLEKSLQMFVWGSFFGFAKTYRRLSCSKVTFWCDFCGFTKAMEQKLEQCMTLIFLVASGRKPGQAIDRRRMFVVQSAWQQHAQSETLAQKDTRPVN